MRDFMCIRVGVEVAAQWFVLIGQVFRFQIKTDSDEIKKD